MFVRHHSVLNISKYFLRERNVKNFLTDSKDCYVALIEQMSCVLERRALSDTSTSHLPLWRLISDFKKGSSEYTKMKP